MNLASEKVWKTKERVRGMGEGVKKEREACLSRSFFIWCRVISGPEIIGILTTLPQLFSVIVERKNFLAGGCLLEKGAGYQTVTAQLKWLLYSYICDRPRSVRPTYQGRSS